MALARWQASITDASGNVLPNAEIEVRNEDGGGLATIYSDRAGATPLANPFTADGDGFAAFHAGGGAYRIDATLGAFTRTWRYVPVGTAAENDFGGISTFNAVSINDGGSISWNVGEILLEQSDAFLNMTGGTLRLGSGAAFIVGSVSSTHQSIDGAASRVQIQGLGATDAALGIIRASNNTASPIIAFGKSRGADPGSHAIVQTGDGLGEIFGAGWDGADFENAASIVFGCDGQPATAGDTTDMPGYLLFLTTPDGSATLSPRFFILNDGGMIATGATGGSKGDGTINAKAVYDDNTLLTSMPLSDEFSKTGDYSVEKWEQKNKRTVPKRTFPIPRKNANGIRVSEPTVFPETAVVIEHKAARRLKAIIDDGVDLRDPKQFCARMKKDKVLPGMPTEKEWKDRGGKISLGEMQSSMWAAMDVLGIMVEKLSERIAELEANK